jgi:hypothetical protein
VYNSLKEKRIKGEGKFLGRKVRKRMMKEIKDVKLINNNIL